MQICGTEWVGHVTLRRKLMGRADALMATASLHPTHDIFNCDGRAPEACPASREGALLIDDLVELGR